MNIFKSSLFIAFIAVSCFLFGNETMNAQDKIVNGYSVNYLDFGQRGKKLGVYEQIGDKKWREVGTSKFNFTETHRDEWSVYLIDKSRNVNIQLDLHRKEVIYSAGNTKKTPIYTIMKTSSKVNGWLVKELIYGNNAGAKLGYFMQQEGKKWQEVSVKDGKHNFVETHRDQWSVYLIDKPRNVSLQLDLHTKKVMYAVGNQRKTPLYTIVETSSKLNSLTMPQSTKPAVKPTPVASPTFATIDHNATYQIIPAYNNLALDIPGSSKANGAKLHQWANHGGINQQFRLEPKGNGYYVIVNVNSGRALDIPGGSKADGAQLVQWDKHGGANQQFGFEKAGADTYIIFNRNSGKVLDVSRGSRDNGGKITQFPK
ncbi:MAG: RICIN domain-containing protein, partial [Chitinophagales bacterium]